MTKTRRSRRCCTKAQFYAWSERAGEKKNACETGNLPWVEFIEQLKDNVRDTGVFPCKQFAVFLMISAFSPKEFDSCYLI